MRRFLKRSFQDFKAHRRAYGSFVLLSVCFLLSLFADLLCNERPLLIVSKGRVYAPFLFKYSGSDFGRDYETQADYSDPKLLSETQASAWVLWAPIRFSPGSIDEQSEESFPSPPDARHLLGTDDRGRDVFTRLIFGFRVSLLFGCLLASLCSALGILIGALQGYKAGSIDLFGQRLTEIWSSIPELLMLMILSSIFQPSFGLLLGSMVLMGWMAFANSIRGECLRLRHMDYVKNAQALGASPFHVILHHILPNAMVPLLSYFPIRVSSGIVSLASLDFLGMGLASSEPSLGELVLQGKAHLQSWWILLSSISTLSLIVLCLTFISEGLLLSFHPKIQKSTN